MRSPRQFWNFRALSYDEAIGPMYEEAYRRTAQLRLKHLSSTARVLDFACGTGIVTVAMAPHVGSIRAIDISEEMVTRAAAKVSAQGLANVDVTQTDLSDPSLEAGDFDAVMAFNVLLYVENFEEVMKRISALLKPGGVFLSATDCLGWNFSKAARMKFWRSRTGKMPYVGFFTRNGLEQKIAQAGFEVLESDNLFPSPPNIFISARKR